MKRSFFGFAVVSLIVGCSASSSSSPSQAGAEDLPEVAAGDLGAACAGFGTGVDETAAFPTDKCAAGICLVDGRGNGDLYCSADCTKVRCPTGYTCEATNHGAPKACFREPSVCGDGTRQPSEACDDGNTADFDGCSADCAKVETPVVSLNVERGTFTFSGKTADFRGQHTIYKRVPTKDGSTTPFDCNEGHSVVDGAIAVVRTTLCTSGGEKLSLSVQMPTTVGRSSSTRVQIVAVYRGQTYLTDIRRAADAVETTVAKKENGALAIEAKLSMQVDDTSFAATLKASIPTK